MSDTKRSHYVPQFNLRGFADEEERIWVYDRAKKEYRHQKVDQVALINHYYRIEKRDGTLSTEIEQFLSEIEGNAASALEKLERGRPITEQEKVYIAVFAALQLTRVPDFEKVQNEMQEKTIRMMYKQTFHSVEAAKREIGKLKDVVGDVSDDVAGDLFKLIREDEYRIEIPRQNNIRQMLKVASHAALYFMQMDWLLLRAGKSGAFITSDNPFTIFPPENYNPNSFIDSAYGILTPDAKKSLPISPCASLFILDAGTRYAENTVPRDKLRIFNIHYARTSDRFIFAKDEALLRSIVERSAVDEIPVDRKRVIVR